MIPYTIYNIFDPVCIGSHIRGEKRSSCSRPLDLHVTHHNVIAKSVSHNLTWHLKDESVFCLQMSSGFTAPRSVASNVWNRVTQCHSDFSYNPLVTLAVSCSSVIHSFGVSVCGPLKALSMLSRPPPRPRPSGLAPQLRVSEPKRHAFCLARTFDASNARKTPVGEISGLSRCLTSTLQSRK